MTEKAGTGQVKEGQVQHIRVIKKRGGRMSKDTHKTRMDGTFKIKQEAPITQQGINVV